ncbi:MAG: thiamine phosphate synthase [Rhodobacterales bacterium]|nr:MAG: thiamine phosphate synthase [Rhodobacterales bacterium]
MTDPEIPQLYLITPPSFDLGTFTDTLERVLDAAEIACLRLDLATQEESDIARAADLVREVAHRRDIPLVVTDHMLLVERLGLDGVHFTDGARHVRKARKAFGDDPIVGSFCHTSRHDGMNAGEAGADYVTFGPAGASSLGDGSQAEAELFAWWSEMIEVPVVAEGGLDAALIRSLSPVTDFFAIGPEIWREDDPAAALKTLAAARVS